MKRVSDSAEGSIKVRARVWRGKEGWRLRRAWSAGSLLDARGLREGGSVGVAGVGGVVIVDAARRERTVPVLAGLGRRSKGRVLRLRTRFMVGGVGGAAAAAAGRRWGEGGMPAPAGLILRSHA